LLGQRITVAGGQDCKNKPGAAVVARIQPNLAAMVVDDLAANRQSNAGPIIFIVIVQTIEHLKYFIGETRFNADTVVSD